MTHCSLLPRNGQSSDNHKTYTIIHYTDSQPHMDYINIDRDILDNDKSKYYTKVRRELQDIY